MFLFRRIGKKEGPDGFLFPKPPISCIVYFALSKKRTEMSNKKKKKKPIKATTVKQQPKKAKKKMSPETKDKLKTSFMTLVNNDACVKASREYHGFWWNFLAVGLALASVVLADVPNLVTRLQVDYGESVLGSPNYSLDQQLTNFSKALADKGVVLTIQDGHPSVNEKWSDIAYTVPGETTPSTWYADYSLTQDKVMFEAFVNSSAVGGYTVEDSIFFARITSGKNPYKDEYRKGYGAEDAKYATNFIAFGQDSFMIGRYNAAGSGSTLMGSNADIEGTNFAAIATKDRDNMGQPLTGDELKNSVTEQYRQIIVTATNRQKLSSSWSYAGIVLAIYAGLEVIFGLVVFLLTRGKRNPFRVYTFWETQKIAYWAGVAPALLSLALGFLLTQFSLMLFIFLFGMRLMWLSMKTMRPN